MILVAAIDVKPPNGDPVETLWVTSGSHYYADYDSAIHECLPDLFESITFEQQLLARNSLNTDVEIGLGKLTITNIRRTYSGYRHHIFDGQTVRIWKLEDEDTPLSSADFYVVRKARYAFVGIEQVEIFIESAQQKFDIELQPALFPETRGGTDIPDWYDGTDEFLGTRRPQIWGRCLGVKPAQLNRYHLLYGVNYDRDGSRAPVYCFWAVYVKGARWECSGDVANMAALIAATVDPGTYLTCNSEGVFRLGTVPGGEVTCDVADAPDLDDGALWNSVPAVVDRILDSIGLVADTDYDTTELYALESGPGGALPCQYVVEGDETAFDAVSSLLGSLSAWAIPDADGMLRFGRVLLASELDLVTPATVFTDAQYDDLVSLPSTTNNGIPASSVRIVYDRHDTKLSAVYESVEESVEGLMTKGYRELILENTDNLHPTAVAEDVETALVVRVPVLIPDPTFYAQEVYWQSLAGADGTVTFPTGGTGVFLNGFTSSAEIYLDMEVSRSVPLLKNFPGLHIDAEVISFTGTPILEMKFGASVATSTISATGTDSNDLSAAAYTFSTIQLRFLAAAGESLSLTGVNWYSATYRAALDAIAERWKQLLCYPVDRYSFTSTLAFMADYPVGSVITLDDTEFDLDGGKNFQVISREEDWADETCKVEILRCLGE